MAEKTEYIGYWGDGKNNFPMPVENESTDNTDAIAKLEEIITNAKVISYRGSSTCRCCNKLNGSKEYVVELNDTAYMIPSGYMHYLADHKIKPSPLIDILYNELLLNPNKKNTNKGIKLKYTR